jgi:hypothetical protein
MKSAMAMITPVTGLFMNITCAIPLAHADKNATAAPPHPDAFDTATSSRGMVPYKGDMNRGRSNPNLRVSRRGARCRCRWG